jgi:LacI family transcriptional regulator, repressor for deo operon, udp, cdd, tsx, nupC, and nupG
MVSAMSERVETQGHQPTGARPTARRAARPGQGKVNMADIARLAGVSMATTSRSLNNLPGVAPATREKVLRVAAELSYVVSPEAAALASGATGRVAVVAPHLSRWFFGEMLSGIESVLRTAGLDLLLYHIGNPEDRERFFTHLPARRKVDAVIVVGIPVTQAEQERLELMGVGIFAAGGQMAEYPFVCIDDVEAGNQAVGHLLHLGHRRIAMIDAIDPNAREWPVDGRALAYTQRLEAAGLPVEPGLFRRVPWGTAPAGEAMAELLSLPEPPTAVFAHSDELAFGAMSTIRRAGLRVPEDISVIGLDGHPLSEALDLTTIGQDVHKQGELAAQLVVDSVTAGSPSASTVLPTRLVPRGSTGPPSPRFASSSARHVT